jgi:putative membrane protein insertion efficiency factor
MKFLFIHTITAYQIVSPIIKQLLGVKSMCRYSPTCSTYAKQVITQYGVFKGTQLSLRRLLSCQPFNKAYGHI